MVTRPTAYDPHRQRLNLPSVLWGWLLVYERWYRAAAETGHTMATENLEALLRDRDGQGNTTESAGEA